MPTVLEPRAYESAPLTPVALPAAALAAPPAAAAVPASLQQKQSKTLSKIQQLMGSQCAADAPQPTGAVNISPPRLVEPPAVSASSLVAHSALGASASSPLSPASEKRVRSAAKLKALLGASPPPLATTSSSSGGSAARAQAKPIVPSKGNAAKILAMMGDGAHTMGDPPTRPAMRAATFSSTSTGAAAVGGGGGDLNLRSLTPPASLLVPPHPLASLVANASPVLASSNCSSASSQEACILAPGAEVVEDFIR